MEAEPEAAVAEGWLLSEGAALEQGFDYIRRAVTKGYFVAPTLTRATQFDALREGAEFQALLAGAEAGRARARDAFRQAGGERLLGHS